MNSQTAVLGQVFQNGQIAIKWKQDVMRISETAGLTTINLEKRKKQMLYSIGDSLSEIASSDNKVNGEEE